MIVVKEIDIVNVNNIEGIMVGGIIQVKVDVNVDKVEVKGFIIEIINAVNHYEVDIKQISMVKDLLVDKVNYFKDILANQVLSKNVLDELNEVIVEDHCIETNIQQVDY